MTDATAAVSGPTLLDYWTLAIAIVGALTGIAALFAQVWSHVLSGPRVKVGISNSLPIPDSGPLRWVLGLEASNVGRLPVTITSSGLMFKGRDGETKKIPIGMARQAVIFGPHGPHRLPDGESATWLLEPAGIAQTVSEQGARDVRGFVSLATGKTVVGRKKIDIVNLANLD